MLTSTNKASNHRTIANIAMAHIALGILMALQIIAYEAWALITPEAVVQRWIVILGFLALLIFVVVNNVFNLSRKASSENLLWIIIAADIVVASFSVYTQRGMAARAVALYAIPILISAVFSRTTSIFMTAGFSVVAYVITTVSYFVLNFNEGYKIELYGEVGFYAIFFIIFAALVWSVTGPKKW